MGKELDLLVSDLELSGQLLGNHVARDQPERVHVLLEGGQFVSAVGVEDLRCRVFSVTSTRDKHHLACQLHGNAKVGYFQIVTAH